MRKATLSLALLILGVAAALAQGEVREVLEPGQIVEIRVGRWDAVQETYTAWDSLGGEVRIGANGAISLPMAGTLAAAERTPDELAEAIAIRFRDRMGLRGEVQVSVTVAAYEPVYVLGDVQAPGAYDFTPGMTVLQAVSLAGGIDDPGAELLRGDRTALGALGSYRVLQLELLGRLATIARLRAELDDSEIEAPEELAAAPLGEELISREREIREARDLAFESSLEQLDELESLLLERITRLERQIELRDRQLVLIEEELANVSQLVDQGLSTATRRSALERQLADQQVRGLELETAKLNAEQRLNETRRDRLDLINSRRQELVEGMQTQLQAVKRLRVQMETEAALYSDALRTGTGLVSLRGEGEPRLEVTRRENGVPRTFTVKRTDEVRGGDVLELTLPELDLGASGRTDALRFGAGLAGSDARPDASRRSIPLAPAISN